MPEYVHGGDVTTYAEVYGAPPLDLSANISPFGIPETVRQAMHAAVEDCTAYPDPFCRAARRAIADAEGVDADRLYCGNGAADVLDRLAAVLRPKTALLTAPTFAEYARTLGKADIRRHFLRESEGFALTERFPDEITPAVDAVYLCNPNNPTGRTVSPELMHRVVEKCAAAGAWLVVDECFCDFLTDPARHTLAPLLGQYPRLVLLRAYTKMYAVPGVRFGWCMSANRELIEALYRAGQPWNVSAVAQACAAAAAGEGAYARETARSIAREREALAAGLAARGLTVYAGEANFLLFRAADSALHEKLASRGILIRNCANYEGLGAGYYRTAVKTARETAALLAALDEIGRAR